MRNEIKELGDAIVRTHDGQMMFNLTEARQIIGCGENTIAHLLHNAGITVKRNGQQKMVNAYQLAEYMCYNRIAPIDNTSRGT